MTDAEDNTDYRVISVDVVPAFDRDDDFEIPDDDIGKWIKTNPEIHARKGDGRTSGLFQRMEGSGADGEILEQQPAPWRKTGQTFVPDRGHGAACLMGAGRGASIANPGLLFHACRSHLRRVAGSGRLGPPISNGMDDARKLRARDLLVAASREATIAIDHARRGRNGEALRGGGSCSARSFHFHDGLRRTAVMAAVFVEGRHG